MWFLITPPRFAEWKSRNKLKNKGRTNSKIIYLLCKQNNLHKSDVWLKSKNVRFLKVSLGLERQNAQCCVICFPVSKSSFSSFQTCVMILVIPLTSHIANQISCCVFWALQRKLHLFEPNQVSFYFMSKYFKLRKIQYNSFLFTEFQFQNFPQQTKFLSKSITTFELIRKIQHFNILLSQFSDRREREGVRCGSENLIKLKSFSFTFHVLEIGERTRASILKSTQRKAERVFGVLDKII